MRTYCHVRAEGRVYIMAKALVETVLEGERAPKSWMKCPAPRCTAWSMSRCIAL